MIVDRRVRGVRHVFGESLIDVQRRHDLGVSSASRLTRGRAEGERERRSVMAVTLRAAIYARVSAVDQEPENQLAEVRRVRRGPRLDGRRVRRPRRERREGPPAGAGPPDRGREATTVRRARVLAPRSPRPEPQAPDHAARGAFRRSASRSCPWPRASTRRRRSASCRCTSSARSRSSSATPIGHRWDNPRQGSRFIHDSRKVGAGPDVWASGRSLCSMFCRRMRRTILMNVHRASGRFINQLRGLSKNTVQ